MNKEKIKVLSDAAFEAEQRYKALGMVNTFGRTQEELKQIKRDYVIAQTEMIEARQDLRAEQGL